MVETIFSRIVCKLDCAQNTKYNYCMYTYKIQNIELYQGTKRNPLFAPTVGCLKTKTLNHFVEVFAFEYILRL